MKEKPDHSKIPICAGSALGTGEVCRRNLRQQDNHRLAVIGASLELLKADGFAESLLPTRP